jgi:hypothetical protein
MKPVSAEISYDGLTLRQAALVAGFGYLLNPVSYAEFSVTRRISLRQQIEQCSKKHLS